VDRDIVCLANSRKYNGKCVAGKSVSDNAWIRPVSRAGKGELNLRQIELADGSLPALLDIIRIPLDKFQPKSYQPENWLITSGKWAKVGTYPSNKLDNLCDRMPILWDNNHPSKDRISCKYIEEKALGSSLLFIRVYNVKILREDKDYEEKKKRTVKVKFSYNQTHYTLSVTDPDLEDEYLNREPGIYSIDADKVYMCISLGEPYERDNCCYKLVAAIITVCDVNNRIDKTHAGVESTTSNKSYNVDEIRKTCPNAYKPWTEGEDAKLREAYEKNLSLDDIANQFGRNKGSIRSRLIKLKLIE